MQGARPLTRLNCHFGSCCSRGTEPRSLLTYNTYDASERISPSIAGGKLGALAPPGTYHSGE